MRETLSETVRRVDEDRWLAAQFADPPARERLIALYTIVYEIARTSQTVREPQLGAIRLQWWRQGIEATLAGRPPSGHPALLALATAHAAAPLAPHLFDQMIDARLRDLDAQPFADWTALNAYVSATAGATAVLATQALAENCAMSAQVGTAWGLCGLWRAQDFWRSQGRTPLPPGATREELAGRVKVELQDLAKQRFSPAAAPAILYASLTAGYLRGRAPSPLEKRWRLVSAALRGRL